MKIRVETRRPDGEWDKKRSVEMDSNGTARRLLRIWQERPDWWSEDMRKGWRLFRPADGEMYQILAFPPEIENFKEYRPVDLFRVGFPYFELFERGDWVVIKWFYPKPEGTEASPEARGWFFFHVEWYAEGANDATPHYRLVSVPGDCGIDPESGDMTVKIGNRDLAFGSFVPPWPDPILEPRFAAIERISNLLKPSGENPLTNLFRSPEPYRSIAKQIAEMLEEAENLFFAGSNRGKLPILELGEDDLRSKYRQWPTSKIRFRHLTEKAQEEVAEFGGGIFYRDKGTHKETYVPIVYRKRG